MPKSFQTINYQYPKPANFDERDPAFLFLKFIPVEKFGIKENQIVFYAKNQI